MFLTPNDMLCKHVFYTCRELYFETDRVITSTVEYKSLSCIL